MIRLYSVSDTDSHWIIQDKRQIKNTFDNTETKHNPEKTNNAKHSKTKLPSFSCHLQHLAYSTMLPSPQAAPYTGCSQKYVF